MRMFLFPFFIFGKKRNGDEGNPTLLRILAKDSRPLGTCVPLNIADV